MTDCNNLDTRFEQFCTSLTGKRDAKANSGKLIDIETIESGSPIPSVSEINIEENHREFITIENDDKFDGKIILNFN